LIRYCLSFKKKSKDQKKDYNKGSMGYLTHLRTNRPTPNKCQGLMLATLYMYTSILKRFYIKMHACK
jgi:hypothetical protein